MSRSIESWFDVRVDNALEGGLKLGQAALDYLLEDLNRRGRVMAQEIADAPPETAVRMLTRLREQSGATEITLLSGTGRVIATASRDIGVLMPNLPSSSALREARQKNGYAAIEPATDEGLLLRVIVPVAAFNLADESRYLQIFATAPQQLAENAEKCKTAGATIRSCRCRARG
ncbi:MAG: hypothetical protein WDN04_24175 [Rhodospirillales bacterium]